MSIGFNGCSTKSISVIKLGKFNRLWVYF
jgi:hypothetical protein